MTAIVGVLLAALYVTMPWWFPTGVLRGYLCRQLAQQTGVDVRIASASLSWSHGLELGGLAIDPPPGFAKRPMVSVAKVLADFSPLEMLLHKRIEWMVFESPQVFMEADPNGRLNLQCLSGLKFDIAARNISAHQAGATLALPEGLPRGTTRAPTDGRGDALLHLHASDVQLQSGRVLSFGRITMSASLVQQGQPAPISLHASEGASDEPVAAQASFQFAGVDLEQFNLPGLLDLPLRKLAGLCGGSLVLRLNRQGKVDQFSFNISIRRLDCQPQEGPELPVIDEAGFRLAASFDPIAQELEVESLNVRLPGIELTGKADMSQDVGEGQWQAIQMIDIQGKVDPTPLAALLTGKAELPGKLSTDGPIQIKLNAWKENPTDLFLRLGARATDAAIRQGGKVIKPAGVPLTAELSGSLDRRTWRFSADQSELVLGENRFKGWGSLRDLPRLIDRWTQAGQPPSLAAVLEDFSALEWQGSWEVREIDSFKGLWPDLAEALKDVRFRGPMTGRWFIDPSSGTRIHASFNFPPETELAVGESFVKPAGAPMTLSIDGMLKARELSLSSLDVDLSVGEGQLAIEHGQLRLREGGQVQAPPAIDAEGLLELKQIESLQKCLPACAKLAGVLGGSVHGRYQIHLAPGSQEAIAELDLGDVEVSDNPVLTKRAGEGSRMTISLARNDAKPPAQRYAVMVTGELPQAVFSIGGESPSAALGAPPEDIHLTASAAIRDAGALARSWPLLKEALGDSEISGPARLGVEGTWCKDEFDGHIECDASDISYAGDAPVRRVKPAGVPLRVQADGKLSDAKGTYAAEVRSLTLDIGKSQTRLRGSASAPIAALKGKLGFPLSYPFQTDLSGEIALNDTAGLEALLPELAGLRKLCQWSGSAQFDTHISGNGKNVLVRSHVDATRLSVASTGPLTMQGPDGKVLQLGRLVKPLDLKAQADCEITLPADPAAAGSRLAVNNLKVELGELSLLAGGSASLVGKNGQLPGGLEAKSIHLAVSTSDAAKLHLLAPSLAPYQLSGQAMLELEYKDPPQSAGQAAGEIPYASLSFNDLRGRWNGKDIRLAGSVLAEKISAAGAAPAATGPQGASQEAQEQSAPVLSLKVGAIKTEGLEFTAGENHGMLIADLRDLPAMPSGSVHILCSYLDDRDLETWLEGQSGQEGQGLATSPRSRPQDVPAAQQAQRLIDVVRPYAAAAELEGKVSIGHLRSLDKTVGQTYDVYRLELTGSLKKGQAQVQYAASVDGGILKQKYEVDLNSASPQVRSERDLVETVASQNMQPQVRKFFPGNTVKGYFSRYENATAPLRDMVACQIDPNYPLHPVGTGKSVATDGVVEGRAAPKFVTAIFPGLNLTQYDYTRMTGFAEYSPDGTAKNDMVFSGRGYDIYMEGATDPDNIGRYEIGLILLGSPQTPELNHDMKLGRIPILKFKALIKDGKLYNQEVSYPWPTETLGIIFIKNNPVYRAWVTAKK